MKSRSAIGHGVGREGARFTAKASGGTIVAHDILGGAGTTAVPGDNLGLTSQFIYIGGGEDINATVATNNLTGGVIDWYCEWYPVNATGRVVSA